MLCSNKCKMSSSPPSNFRSSDRRNQCKALQQRQQMFNIPRIKMFVKEGIVNKNDTLI